MSTVIPFRFETRYDRGLLSAGVRFNLIRLICDVDFESSDGWSSKYQAIVDTGSPANLIPLSIWAEAKNRIILTKEFSLTGIGSGRVSGYLGEVTARFSYGSKSSGPLKIRTFLLNSDAVPLILGFDEFLDRGLLKSDYPKNLASLKF